MKIISEGLPEERGAPAPKKKRRTAGIAALAVVAVLATVISIAVPVYARQPAKAGIEPADTALPVLQEDAPDIEPEADVRQDIPAAPAVSASSAQGLFAQFDIAAAAVPDEDGDAAAAVPDSEDVTGDEEEPEETATEPEEAAEAATELVATEEPEQPARTEEPAWTEEPVQAEEPVETETDPPEWLVIESGTDPDLPEGELTMGEEPVQEAEPAPEWLLTMLDKAMWRNPYDGGPLCQKSWAQIPVPLDNCGTRAYVELDTTVAWLSQGDLLGFAGNSIRYCDADWFTIVGSDGWGIQFPGCGTDYAVYGPLDEYGEVTTVVRFIFLGEDGYYAVEPI